MKPSIPTAMSVPMGTMVCGRKSSRCVCGRAMYTRSHNTDTTKMKSAPPMVTMPCFVMRCDGGPSRRTCFPIRRRRSSPMYGAPSTRPRRNAARSTPSARIAIRASRNGRPDERVRETIERERVRAFHEDRVVRTLQSLQEDERLGAVRHDVRLRETRAVRRRDRRSRELAHADEHVRALRRLSADLLVRVGGEGAELEHVADHHDPATTNAT